ncbi:MAG: ABC transporter ATP-binding protein [Chloroflexota bacterium]|nr:ABC transporter ATP-binding protein [Chloroflexota bacterium]
MASRSRSTFLRYLRRHRSKLIAGTITVVASSFFAVIPPRFIGGIVDDVNGGAPFSAIVVLALAMIGVAAMEALVRGFGRYQIIDSSRLVEYEMRNDLLSHLEEMELGYFQHQRIGDLMARLTNDLTAVRQMYGFGILMLVSTTSILVLSIASMLQVNVKLTVLSLVLMPVASVSFWAIGRRVNERFQQLQAQFGDLSTKAQENFSGIRVVKAYSQEEPEIRSFADVNMEYVRRAIDLARLNGLVWPAMNFIMGCAVLAALYVGGTDAIGRKMTVGELIQFVAYLYLLQWPMISFGEITNIFQQGWASLVRLQELFDARAAIAEPIDPVASPIRGEVELRGVTFAYGNTIVLRDVTFTVPAGGSLAIVGPTGSGKSTLVNLIPRLFDVQQGEVLVDGVNVRRYPLPVLRRAIGYVPQETYLFSLPLRENVGFGSEQELPEERLEWAADVAQLDKDVEDFPARYDTMIGERGVTLSGGQKQRAAIARAVAKDPRVLILDDALSAVDTYTESEILRRLRGVMRERTSIVVAHRISTVKDADEILVLDDGRIVERGTHAQLLATGGLYAQMYRRQLLEEELEVDVEQAEHERRVRPEPEDGSVARAPRIPGEGLGEGTP